ncbi:hypothetical protein AVEN_141696-1 [Araneus ventricosus]|uniref:PNPLA domain-containing protein n=1 Tax=Araneus ventricosus TaxID=182803 RepID=A0A4Y2UEX2_ARAVE|nr:hypothetical protein AVEN_141696-1 [Araneus ventricosus]
MGRAKRNDSTSIDPRQMNLSLNGCGYLGIYHVGVCSCIRKYYPQSLRNKISGGSVGALVACAFMCDVPLVGKKLWVNENFEPTPFELDGSSTNSVEFILPIRGGPRPGQTGHLSVAPQRECEGKNVLID